MWWLQMYQLFYDTNLRMVFMFKICRINRVFYYRWKSLTYHKTKLLYNICLTSTIVSSVSLNIIMFFAFVPTLWSLTSSIESRRNSKSNFSRERLDWDGKHRFDQKWWEIKYFRGLWLKGGLAGWGVSITSAVSQSAVCWGRCFICMSVLLAASRRLKGKPILFTPHFTRTTGESKIIPFKLPQNCFVKTSVS